MHLRASLVLAAELVHPCDVGPTSCCHGYPLLTAQELCRLVEDIINNKGLEAKVAWDSVWETSSHCYYNWHPLRSCVWVGVCWCHEKSLGGGGKNSITLCCIYLLDKQFALNRSSWLLRWNSLGKWIFFSVRWFLSILDMFRKLIHVLTDLFWA